MQQGRQNSHFVVVFISIVLLASLLSGKTVYAQGRLKVMLLGDSYTAGNGARKDDGATDNFGPKGCYRSNSNWGRLYISRLQSLGYNVTVINRACSGSVSNDLLYDNDMKAESTWLKTYESLGVSISVNDDGLSQAISKQYSCERREKGEEYYRFSIDKKSQNTVEFSCRRYVKAQLDSVDDSVDLVLMTIGGNDIKFSDIVMACFAPVISGVTDCNKVNEDSRRYGASTDIGSYQSNMTQIVNELRNRLRSDSKVVLLNYPYLAKDDNFVLKDLFSSNSYAASKNVRELGRFGDEVQANLIPAQEPDKASIYYFDEIKDHFTNHEPDMSDFWHNNPDKWINTFGSRLPTDWFHFNSIGHQEVANILYKDLENHINGFPLKTKLDYDVVFVYNEASEANTYQRDDLAIKGITIGKIRDKVLSVANTARFGIVGYNLWTGSEGRTGDKSALKQDFTSDIFQLSKKVPRFSDLLGRTQEGELKNALQTALDMKWRPGVKKLVYIIGKTKADDANLNSDYYSDVIEKALNLDPVAISPLMASNNFGTNDDQALTLASETSGKLVTSNRPQDYSSNWASNQMNASTIVAPYAWAGEGIDAKVGEEVMFDASGSYSDIGIIKYEWDVNNDGEFDIVSDKPVAKYVYPDNYTGLVVLRITDSKSVTALASFQTTITKDADSIADDVDNCPLDWNEDQADADDDGIGDICDDSPGIVGYQTSTQPNADENTQQKIDENQSANTSDSKITISSDNSKKQSFSSSSAKNNKERSVANYQTKQLGALDNKASRVVSLPEKHSSSKLKILFSFGALTGLAMSMYMFNTELLEDDEL